MISDLNHLNDFEDDQMLRLVNNTIISKTEFEVKDFTGGSLQITSTNNHTVTNYKMSLFFGYKNNKPVARTITISKDMFFIWAKALMLKAMSIKTDILGINYAELNKLMNTDFSNNFNSNSIVGVGLPLDLTKKKEEHESYEDYQERCEELTKLLFESQIKKDKERDRLKDLSLQNKNNEVVS